jgi:hypothetical protein
VRKVSKMRRYILSSYGVDGVVVKSFIDASAAAKAYIQLVDPDGDVDKLQYALEQGGYRFSDGRVIAMLRSTEIY